MIEKNYGFRKMQLLPHAFKTAGFIIAAVGAISLPMMIFLKGHIDKQTLLILAQCCASVMLLGLLAAALSQEKQEDEMLTSIRLTAIFRAFVFVSVYIAILPLIMFFKPALNTPAWAYILSMLAYYHLTFWFMKLKMRNEKHD